MNISTMFAMVMASGLAFSRSACNEDMLSTDAMNTEQAWKSLEAVSYKQTNKQKRRSETRDGGDMGEISTSD